MKIRVQMQAGTSSVSVGGESYEPDADGVIVLNSPEHVGPLVALGGIELGPDGEPGRIAILLGSDTLPSMIDIGEGVPPISLGQLVSETHEKSGISVDDWNNLPQRVREILLRFHLGFKNGDIADRTTDDPRVEGLLARVAELDLELVAARALIEELRPVEEKPADEGKEKPDFTAMTKAKINEWLEANGVLPLTTGSHADFVAAADDRWAVLNPAASE